MEALRRKPLLQMTASDELFIVEVTLLQAGCPAPNCPEAGWRHANGPFPNQCLSWWSDTGCRLVGWHRYPADVDSVTVREKIRQFRKNFLCRGEKKRADDLSQQSDQGQQMCDNVSYVDDNIKQVGVMLSYYI